MSAGSSLLPQSLVGYGQRTLSLPTSQTRRFWEAKQSNFQLLVSSAADRLRSVCLHVCLVVFSNEQQQIRQRLVSLCNDSEMRINGNYPILCREVELLPTPDTISAREPPKWPTLSVITVQSLPERGEGAHRVCGFAPAPLPKPFQAHDPTAAPHLRDVASRKKQNPRGKPGGPSLVLGETAYRTIDGGSCLA